MSTVLVTGGSGFVGTHCILQLLAAGHTVRTTVRDLKREGAVRELLATGAAQGLAPGVTAGAVQAGAPLSFYAANLSSDGGWREAVAGCDYVLHVASPFPAGAPRHEDELIIPAREGALRVLKSARDSGVKRVVLTSSFAAVGYGHGPRETPFDESDWTNVDAPGTPAYVKSKALAERAAWDFIAREGGALELAVINPVAVFGPALGADYAASVELIARLLKGLPGCPRVYFGAVDVRDVADIHLRAMTHPEAKGERFLAVAGDEVLSILEIARILRERLGAAARRAPTRELPDWLVRFGALFSRDLQAVAPQLGLVKRASGAKARRVLGWAPRSSADAIAAAGESLVKLGIVK